MYGEAYWDESAFYQFTLPQIEDHIEAPEEIHRCVYTWLIGCSDDELLKKFCILNTRIPFKLWKQKDPGLYSV